MASPPLVFVRPALPIAGGPVALVFGQGGGAPEQPTVTLAGGGRISGLRGHQALRIAVRAQAAGRITGLAIGAPLRVVVRAQAAGHISGLRASRAARWDANVSRGGLRHEARTHWQPAAPVACATLQRWQQSLALAVGAVARWQQASRLRAALQQDWQEASRLRAVAAARWQQADGRRASVLQLWQEAVRLRAGAAVLWQDADRLRAATRLHWQETIRLRAAVRSHWQDADPARASVHAGYGDGLRLRIHLRPHWQQGWRPRAGVSSIRPPVRPPCYVPGPPVPLVFAELAAPGLPLRLVFRCDHKPGPGPDPDPAQWVIPVLEVYMTTHSLAAVLLPSLAPVALLGATIESDDGGFGWSLQASGPEHLLDQLAPVSGLPARVRVTVDGHDWVFAVERIARSRRFGEHRVSIQGRSTTALLGAPYLPEQSWLNPLQITAQQAIVNALEYTGTALDWGIDDWTLPAGAWSLRGTPLQAALRVAEAAGAVLRSHPTEQKLIVRPRYPVLPWEWGAAAPTLQMPAAIITTDDLQPEPRAPYNAVYVSGMAGGVLGHVRRAGTAGDLLAPQVTDQLITAEVAARMRGSAELSAAGKKLMQTMTLPMLTDTWSPGPVLPGWLVQVDDIGHSWRGLVRSIRIDAGMPVVRQTVQVERVAA